MTCDANDLQDTLTALDEAFGCYLPFVHVSVTAPTFALPIIAPEPDGCISRVAASPWCSLHIYRCTDRQGRTHFAAGIRSGEFGLHRDPGVRAHMQEQGLGSSLLEDSRALAAENENASSADHIRFALAALNRALMETRLWVMPAAVPAAVANALPALGVSDVVDDADVVGAEPLAALYDEIHQRLRGLIDRDAPGATYAFERWNTWLCMEPCLSTITYGVPLNAGATFELFYSDGEAFGLPPGRILVAHREFPDSFANGPTSRRQRRLHAFARQNICIHVGDLDIEAQVDLLLRALEAFPLLPKDLAALPPAEIPGVTVVTQHPSGLHYRRFKDELSPGEDDPHALDLTTKVAARHASMAVDMSAAEKVLLGGDDVHLRLVRADYPLRAESAVCSALAHALERVTDHGVRGMMRLITPGQNPTVIGIITRAPSAEGPSLVVQVEEAVPPMLRDSRVLWNDPAQIEHERSFMTLKIAVLRGDVPDRDSVVEVRMVRASVDPYGDETDRLIETFRLLNAYLLSNFTPETAPYRELRFAQSDILIADDYFVRLFGGLWGIRPGQNELLAQEYTQDPGPGAVRGFTLAWDTITVPRR